MARSQKRTGKAASETEPAPKVRKTHGETSEFDKPVEATLELADGTTFTGFSFGAKCSGAGEVVFNTGMVGYPEALSDPSYRGQILVLTYPLIGNYGVPGHNIFDELGLPKNFESEGIHISGLVVSSYSPDHSHWASQGALGEWLAENNIPGIFGVDTRALTKLIRETGAVLGKIMYNNEPIELIDPNVSNLVAEVSTTEVKVYGEGQSPRILCYDCGIKYNIIRYLVTHQKVCCIVVPYDYDLAANPANIEYDGLFLSNGPGDPAMCSSTIASVQWAITRPDNETKPVFGICLGNQLLSLAAGASTYKMKYGNRGANQPCIDLRTGRCYITPQNHGFAVDNNSLPSDWKPFFINANDFSNEGVIHVSKPFFSVQFHPEAAGGPMDTAFLFEMFVQMVRGNPARLTLLDPMVYQPAQSPARKVLILGSGGLSIGQAGEFDYSGSQAIKALKEEGVEVVLINPNIATVQTSQNLGGASPDSVYFLPVTRKTVNEVIEKERPDSILVSMGGQTALNCGIELWDAGDLQRQNVRVLGTQIPVIVATEDREIFSEKLHEINETLALSYPATDIEGAVEAAAKIGYPVLVRAAFALGGLGSGFADNEEELRALAEKAFSCSDQILIDQDLRGWKEVEYEVVRDARDNCITVCNMENFDPLGVHTGDSIVVAPSQTLTNREYYKLRATALKVVRHLGIVGECNIQYALNPESEQYCIIEVNARLSRSSALASKATGYPLAYVAAKLSLGIDLVSIRNSVTKTTTACFEPSLDYCVIKMPRWDLHKFQRVSHALGSSMKSVGEVMSIGRSFEEAMQKAVRMVSPGSPGLEGLNMSKEEIKSTLNTMLSKPTDKRLYAVQTAFEHGYTVDQVHNLSKIDRWFLSKLRKISGLKRECLDRGASSNGVESLTKANFMTLKQAGFADVQLANYLNTTESIVRRRRLQMQVKPVVKQIDTLAAEFPAQTNYLYMTYHGTTDDVEADKDGVIVLGCGAYCIGSSVEFDWSAVSCIRQVRAVGNRAIVINYNPETVSTDYDESDRLYFEELSLERILDIFEHETANGVIVSVGGQVAQNVALPLKQAGVRILGTDPDDIDRAEDRHKFSAMLDSIGVDQPPWRELSGLDDALQFAEEVKYPVLVRPSFVLSGAGMNVASNASQLTAYLKDAGAASSTIVVSKFITNAKEIEFDGVGLEGKVLNYAISEHIENAGVHSGDATLVLPAQKLYQETTRRVKIIGRAVCKALNITGPFNMQLMARGNELKVIECNLRASRTFPFISKTMNCNFITLATKAMLGLNPKPYNISLDLDYVAVKAPMFSFTRLRGADPTLGVEMSSTGEVACFGGNLQEAFLAAIESTGFKLPPVDGSILVSIAKSDSVVEGQDARHEFLPYMKQMEELGLTLYGTPGTAEYYQKHGIAVTPLAKPRATSFVAEAADPGADKMEEDEESRPRLSDDESEEITAPTIEKALEVIRSGKIHMVINVPEGSNKEGAVSNGYMIRRTTVDFGISLLTNIKVAKLFVESFAKKNAKEGLEVPVQTIQEFYEVDKLI